MNRIIDLGLDGDAQVGVLDTTVTTGTKGDDTLDGTAGKDVVRGLAGDDLIQGMGGKDRLFGGSGNDTLDGGAGQDTIGTGKGEDLVFASGGGHQANQGDHLDGGAGFDIVSFAHIDADVYVDLDGQVMQSDATGSGLVAGFEGVIGGAGDDVIWGRIGVACSLEGGDGSDTIHGRGGADTVMGGDGDDFLSGFADTLVGGLGADGMTGGFHDNWGTVFLYTALEDSTNEAPDTISGLRGQQIIDLHLIDADTAQAGDQAFHLVSGGFTGHAGELQLVYDEASDTTVLTVDVDGDAAADMTIDIEGDRSSFHHFVL